MLVAPPAMAIYAGVPSGYSHICQSSSWLRPYMRWPPWLQLYMQVAPLAAALYVVAPGNSDLAPVDAAPRVCPSSLAVLGVWSPPLQAPCVSGLPAVPGDQGVKGRHFLGSAWQTWPIRHNCGWRGHPILQRPSARLFLNSVPACLCPVREPARTACGAWAPHGRRGPGPPRSPAQRACELALTGGGPAALRLPVQAMDSLLSAGLGRSLRRGTRWGPGPGTVRCLGCRLRVCVLQLLTGRCRVPHRAPVLLGARGLKTTEPVGAGQCRLLLCWGEEWVGGCSFGAAPQYFF